MGRLLALTANDEANTLACQHFVDDFGSSSVYQLPPDLSPRNGDAPNQPRLGRLLFAPAATYAHLDEWLDQGAMVKTTQLTDKYTWADFQRERSARVVPLLAVLGGHITVATAERPFRPPAGSQLISLATE
jgi:hypothetical protein